MLIHCGDFLDGANPPKSLLADVDDWFGSLRFEKILVVGGNHDFDAELRYGFGDRVFENAEFLVDRALSHGGLTFYGAPWVPELAGWAFYADEKQLAKKWRRIPRDVDVLITHTPPAGLLDQPFGASIHLGCPLLAARVRQLQPRLHCFGHVHASHGQMTIDQTTFVNAALATGEYPYKLGHAPVIIEL